MRDLTPTALPNRPNWVASRSPLPQQSIAPFRYEDDLKTARERLRSIVTAMPRCRCVAEDETTLRFEFRSLIFRFVDDLEFSFDEATKTVHCCSASRLGYSDLGVNRRRLESIRKRFE